MTSLLTNASAMTSLQALAATQRQLATTQAQISSGLAVANASDNAAYWSIGQTMSAQVAGLGAVNRGMALTMSIADVTAAALTSIKGSLDRIQADVVTAGQAGVDKSAVQADISAQQRSIIAVANSASFNGVNWLVDRISTSEQVTIEASGGVPKSEYIAIGDGLRPGESTTFDLHEVDTLTRTDGTSSGTVTTTYTTHTDLSDASDGAVSLTKSPPMVTTSGDAGGAQVGVVPVPVGLSASGGIVTSPFSLAPLTLFSELTGTYGSKTTVTLGGVKDLDDSSQVDPVPLAAANSYDGYGSAATQGILDGVIYLPGASSGASSGGSPGGSPSGPSPLGTQTTFQFDLTGGSLDTTSQGGGGGSTGGTSGGTAGQLVRETILTMDITNASDHDLAMAGLELQAAITGIIGASTAVGALQTRLTTMQAFDAALSDALTSGVGSLVDADMNVASTRLQALQTQQQLGIQALSIANQDGQLILKLFQAA